MLKSSLCDYSDTYIVVKETITGNNTAAADAGANNNNKKVIFKTCVPFINCTSEINNTQVDNAKDVDIVMSVYNLIEYSDNYSKKSGGSWQYFRDNPAVKNNDDIVIFTKNNLTESFKLKEKITGQTEAKGTKDVEIMIPLKYLSVFWRSLKMSLINCVINLILIWSGNCVIVSTDVANQNAKLTISDTKLYVPYDFFNSR